MIHLHVWEWVAVCLLPGTGGLLHFAQMYGYGRAEWPEALKQANNVAIALLIVSTAYILVHVGPVR